MLAEASQFMILDNAQNPVSLLEFYPKDDTLTSEYILFDYDQASKLAEKYHKKYGHPVSVVKLVSINTTAVDKRNTDLSEKYPELKGDLIIKLWNRTKSFLRDRSEGKGELQDISLREHLVHDYSWIAKGTIKYGGMENPDFVNYVGYGIEAHEAMLNLFHNAKNDIPEDKL